MTPANGSCANCAEPLVGEYCSRCGQRAVSLQRPAMDLLSDAVGDLLNLDTRLVRTLRPPVSYTHLTLPTILRV